MSFLSPLLLLAAAAVAVPVLLHLYHRHENRRVVFPALRYLLRTEREHARSIRLRQLLLLLLRVSIVLLLVLAAARPFLHAGDASHDPTALAVVLDNSLSSGRVVGEARVLDALKARALEALDAAGPEDRIWVIRAGEPWDVAQPGAVAEARERVEGTEPTAARGDLRAALSRAGDLVASAGLPASEIHLLSDLQRTAFGDPADPRPEGDAPVVAWAPPPPETPNRFLLGPVVGGGLAPLAGQRTEIAVTVGASPAANTSASPLPVRVVTGERVRAVGSGRPGEDVVLSVGPFASGTVEGFVETDPDALGADDRRWFAFDVRPAVAVRREGGPSFFLDQGLRVLEDAGRIRRAEAEAAVLVAVGGAGLEARRGTPAVVVPDVDPALLPALNRRLAEAGVPWRYEAPGGDGETEVTASRLPVAIDGERVRRHYRLRPAGAAGGPRPDEPPAGEILAGLSSGDPLLVSGSAPSGPWLLLATPLDPEWTDLPVGASMVPLLEWSVARWAAGEGRRRVTSGQEIPTPPEATSVRDPEGTVHPVAGSRSFRRTALAGIYEVLADDRVLQRVAVNPPAAESLLEPVEPDELDALVGGVASVADDPDAWRRAIFRSRQGPELWRPLLAAALILLLVEAWVAASGGRDRGRRPAGGPARAAPAGTQEPGRGEPWRETARPEATSGSAP